MKRGFAVHRAIFDKKPGFLSLQGAGLRPGNSSPIIWTQPITLLMLKRLTNLIKGFFGLFIGDLEKKNPEALLEVEKENLRKQISEFNKGLANHAGLCERLMSRVRTLEKQYDELRAKTSANLKAGNKKLAGQYALQLKEVTREMDSNEKQLEEAEARYKELINARDVSVKEARTKIEKLRRGIDEMKVEKAMAELNEMAAGMVNEIGEGGDTLNRLEEIVEEERAKAAGRARVARGMIDTTEVEMKESEQEAMEEQALADFAAMEGLDIGEKPAPAEKDDTEPEKETNRTMGPKETE